MLLIVPIPVIHVLPMKAKHACIHRAQRRWDIKRDLAIGWVLIEILMIANCEFFLVQSDHEHYAIIIMV